MKKLILIIAILTAFVSLSHAQVIRTLDSNGNPQFVSPTNRVPVDVNGATINATITELVPPATLNLSSDSVAISAGAVDSSCTFPGATQYVDVYVFSVDGYIKVATNRTITSIIGEAFPYSHTKETIFAPTVFARSKIYVKNTGSSTCHVLYNGGYK